MTIHPRQVLSAFGWSFVQSWGSQLTKLVIFIVLARLLDARDVGLVAFALVFISAGQAFALAGVSDALIQKKDLSQGTMSAVFWLNMLIAGALALGLFLIAPLLESWFGMEGLATVLRWICPALLLQALAAVQVAQFRRKLQMRPVALRDLLASLLGGIAGILAALNGWGVYALVVNVLLGRLLGTTFLWWSSSWRPDWSLRISQVRELVGFALQRTGSTSLAFLNTRLDDLFVGAFLGPIALGYYAVAYKILQSINATATAVVGRAAFPLFCRLQEDKAELQRIFLQVSRVAAAIAMGLFGGLFFFAPQIVELLFGEQWMPSVTTMRILCVAGVATNLLNLNRLLLRSTGKAGWELLTFVGQALLCSVGFYFAAQVSIEAVALVAAEIMLALVPCLLALNRYAVGVPIIAYLTNAVAPFLVALAVGLLVLFAQSHFPEGGWFLVSVACLLFAVLYSLVAGLLLRRDLVALKTLLPQPRSNQVLQELAK
jgi:O-antigen/teichoic acid export membrane protein